MTPSITQTRASLLTAHGVGAVAVIRVEGAFAAETVQSLLQHFRDDRPVVLAHGRPKFARIVDGVEIIDDVVVTADRFGDGFCVDICAHAGVRIVERILACLKNRGCAVDEPAAHHAWDWAAKNQLELEVSELLPLAKSHFAARFLLAQQLLWPEWVAKIGNWIATAPADALGELRDVVERFTIAQRLIHGARIAIVGPPNVGKSTLFNRLVGRPAAIVADQPGTTRDWISTDIELAGLPVTLIDTAGYRTTEDPLEQASIHLGGLTAIQADLCLTVVDPTTMGRLTEFEYSICNENPQSQQESKHHAPEPQASKMLTLKVLNKCETLPDSCPQTEQMETHSDLIAISARNGLGFDVLVERILLALNVPKKPDFVVMPITNRQRSLLCEFLSDVDRTAETWETTAAKLLGVAPCSTESARL